MTLTLFEDIPEEGPSIDSLGPGAAILRNFALDRAPLLLDALFTVAAKSPFRHMVTPGGFRMSVAMTNCGSLGWVTDRKGYRYDRFDPLAPIDPIDPIDPKTQALWPPMPKPFLELAQSAATAAGFPQFSPDACLINRYEPGARLTLHQDRNERDFNQPIVSVSLGLPAVFLFGGDDRAGKTTRIPVQHGDVVVWGGPARLRYHGVMPLKEGLHPQAGRYRFNLTFRKAA